MPDAQAELPEDESPNPDAVAHGEAMIDAYQQLILLRPDLKQLFGGTVANVEPNNPAGCLVFYADYNVNDDVGELKHGPSRVELRIQVTIMDITRVTKLGKDEEMVEKRIYRSIGADTTKAVLMAMREGNRRTVVEGQLLYTFNQLEPRIQTNQQIDYSQRLETMSNLTKAVNNASLALIGEEVVASD